MGKLEFDKRKDSEIWIYCNDCKRDTSHKILTGIDYRDVVEGPDIHYWVGADIVQCGGCKHIIFTKRATDSESYSQGDEDIVSQYPPKEEDSKSHVKDHIYELPFLLRQIYEETLRAICNKSYTLAAIGLRAIIETLCKDKSVKGADLEKRIDNLVTAGFLTSSGSEILHGIRLIGNDAAHETKAPRKEQISAAVKVIDHLILGIYIIPEEASKALPKRNSKGENETAQSTITTDPETSSAK